MYWEYKLHDIADREPEGQVGSSRIHVRGDESRHRAGRVQEVHRRPAGLHPAVADRILVGIVAARAIQGDEAGLVLVLGLARVRHQRIVGP
jgi:hypothetical protein